MFSFGFMFLFLSGASAVAEPGSGINLGQVKLSPHVGASTGYETNVFRQAADEATGDGLTGSAFVQVNPGLAAELKNTDLEARLAWDQFLRAYPGLAAISYVDNYTVSGTALIFPKGKLSIGLHESARRRSFVNQTADFSEDTSSGYELGDLLSHRNINDLGFSVKYTPGGALDFIFGTSWYREGNNLLTGTTTGDVSGDTIGLVSVVKTDVVVDGTVKWRFFPRTALAMDMQLRPVSVNQSEVELGGVTYSHPDDSFIWSVLFGLEGQLTPTIQVIAKTGYGQVRNASDEMEDGAAVLGQAAIQWRPRETQGLSFSAYRTLRTEFYTDYVLSSGLALRYSGTFIDRVETSASVSLEAPRVDFLPTSGTADGTITDVVGERPDADLRYRMGLSAAYRVFPWLKATATYSLTVVNSAVSDDADIAPQNYFGLGVMATY